MQRLAVYNASGLKGYMFLIPLIVLHADPHMFDICLSFAISVLSDNGWKVKPVNICYTRQTKTGQTS